MYRSGRKCTWYNVYNKVHLSNYFDKTRFICLSSPPAQSLSPNVDHSCPISFKLFNSSVQLILRKYCKLRQGDLPIGLYCSCSSTVSFRVLCSQRCPIVCSFFQTRQTIAITACSLVFDLKSAWRIQTVFMRIRTRIFFVAKREN